MSEPMVSHREPDRAHLEAKAPPTEQDNEALQRRVDEALVVGAASDHVERDADERAERAMRRLAGTGHDLAGHESVDRPALAARRSSDGATSGAIGAAGGRLDDESSARVTAAAGRGRPLSDDIRRRYSHALGSDVSAARIHDGQEAHALARGMSASAFTVGNDIFFSAGTYRPDDAAGAHLLAHELAHVVQNAGGARRSVAHRKIGFELEDNSWESYRRLDPPDDRQWTDNPLYEPKPRAGGANVFAGATGAHVDNDVREHGVEAFAKKDKLHSGDGWALESDGPYSHGVMDIEVVTDPFEETSSGLKKLESAFDGIATVMKRLNSMPKMPRDARAGQFFGPDEHRLDNTELMLAKGSPRPSFKMQVTHGVRLGDIPEMFAAFGSRTESEHPKESKNRAGARQLLPTGKVALQQDVMAASPDQARRLIDVLQREGIVPDGPTPELLGFFTYAFAYVQWLQVLPWTGLKIALPFMSRYDFAKLLKMVPEKHRAGLYEKKARRTFHDTTGIIVKKFGITNAKRKTPLGEGPMMEFNDGGNTFPAAKLEFYNLLMSLTVEDWFDGLLDGTDRLTATGIYDWLHNEGEGEGADGYQKSLNIFSRGHGSTKSLKGAEDDLAIMENRAIDPDIAQTTGLDVKQARTIATSYFSYMISLRKGKPSFKENKL